MAEPDAIELFRRTRANNFALALSKEQVVQVHEQLELLRAQLAARDAECAALRERLRAALRVASRLRGGDMPCGAYPTRDPNMKHVECGDSCVRAVAERLCAEDDVQAFFADAHDAVAVLDAGEQG